MFKFGFSNEDNVEESTSQEKPNNVSNWAQCEEIKGEFVDLQQYPNINSAKCGELLIKHLSSNEVLRVFNKNSHQNAVFNAEQNHSDLITAIYEGGLKIWECTYDLLDFINNSNSIKLKDKSILDLGCGAGINGILSGLKGAKAYFQDYNEEVIKYVTIPNVQLNGIPFDQCKFYSGDWSSFSNKVDQKFDYIFTSETIYNVENYRKLCEVFNKLLKKSGEMYPSPVY